MKGLQDYHLRSILALFNTPATGGGNVEREMRFGCFVPSATGAKQFQSRVGEHIFTNVLAKYRSIAQPMVRSTSLYYPNDLRITKYDDGREEYMLKKKSKPFNIYEYGLRFAADIEIPIDPETPSVPPLYIRIRERYRIPFSGYAMDLTKVIAGASITYELEVEFQKTYRDTRDLYQDIVKIYDSVFDRKSREGIKLFNNLTGGEASEACATFQFPKPEDFNILSFMDSVTQKYGISLKADGTHRFAMINNDTFYVVQLPDYIHSVKLNTSKLQPVVFEGEEIQDPTTGVKCFCAFDVLGYHGKQEGRYRSVLQGVDYSARYKILKTIANVLIGVGAPVAVKNVCFSSTVDELYACTTSLLDSNNKKRFYSIPPEYGYRDDSSIPAPLPLNVKQGFETDGLIFTPDIEYVGTFKKESKAVENDNSYRSIIRKWKPENKLTIDFLYLDGKLYNVSREGRSEFQVPMSPPVTTRGKETIQNGQVGEFLWNREAQRFELHRVRYDKSEGNSVSVANKLWKLIIDPLYESTIKGQDIRLVRKYHNMIKRNIISTNVKSGDVVLDIGGGNGGDLSKYEQAGVKTLLYVEPNPRNLAELERRLGQNPPKTMKVFTLNAYGQETKKIIEFVKKHTSGNVDVVAMFFSLTFFFVSEQDLNGLVSTISSTLAPAGRFIGTFTNGKAVEQLLSKGDYQTPAFSMKYTGGMGLTPEVKLRIDDSIVGDQIEYLVDFNILESKLVDTGIVTDIEKPFAPHPSFNTTQQTFNSLYSEFVSTRGFGMRDLSVKVPSTSRPSKVPEVPKVPQVPNQSSKQVPITSKLSSDTIRAFTASGDDAILMCLLSIISRSNVANSTKIRKELRPLAEHIYPLLTLKAKSAKSFGRHIASGDPLTQGIDIEFLCEYLRHSIVIIDGKSLQLLSVNGSPVSEFTEMRHLYCIILSKEDENTYSVVAQVQATGNKLRFALGNDIVNELLRKRKLM